jgi:hypothetical protein
VGLANLGSESETCVGSRVHLVGVSISFEKNFYRLPFTPPSLVRRIGPSHGRRCTESTCSALTPQRRGSYRRLAPAAAHGRCGGGASHGCDDGGRALQIPVASSSDLRGVPSGERKAQELWRGWRCTGGSGMAPAWRRRKNDRRGGAPVPRGRAATRRCRLWCGWQTELQQAALPRPQHLAALAGCHRMRKG